MTVALAVVSKSKGDGGNEPKRHDSGAIARGQSQMMSVIVRGEPKDGMLPESGTDRGRKGGSKIKGTRMSFVNGLLDGARIAVHIRQWS